MKVLKNADLTYAYCLQYGLITFGFTEKDNQRIFLETEAFQEKASSFIEEVESRLRKITEGFEQRQSELLSNIRSENDSTKETFDSAVASANSSIDTLGKLKTELDEKIEATSASFEEQEKKKVEVTAIFEKISAVLASSTEELETIEATVKDGKANLDSIKEMKAGSKEVLDEIKSFFAEISSNEKKMLDMKKDAADSFIKLSKDSQDAVEKYSKQTEEIVRNNAKQQIEIKEHLRKAIGASLFSAFDIRREKLRWGKWIWSSLLVLFVGVGIWVTFLIAKDLQGVPDKAFFVKVTAVIPIAFFIAFSAKQYTNERRAEEEYAFKSTISISLEPYYDLVEKIRKNHPDADPEFVKNLIYEIFDNPVKRIYYGDGNSKSTENNAGNLREIIKKITDTFTPEQVKEVRGMLETLSELGKAK